MAAKKTGKKSKSPKGGIKKGTCFIITPFGEWFDDYYETIYEPAIEAGGLIAKRADDLFRPGTIINDIWKFAQEATIVLADLTQKNPNVFYELGLAHALAKPAILITEAIDNVPFDLRSLRVLKYDKNLSNWGEELKADITSAIKEVQKAPLEAVLPTFLHKTSEPIKKPKSSAESRAITSLRLEMDALRREFLSSPRRILSRETGPSEALGIIRELVNAGAPDSYIYQELSSKGVPEHWARRRIIEEKEKLIKRTHSQEAKEDSSKPPDKTSTGAKNS